MIGENSDTADSKQGKRSHETARIRQNIPASRVDRIAEEHNFISGDGDLYTFSYNNRITHLLVTRSAELFAPA